MSGFLSISVVVSDMLHKKKAKNTPPTPEGRGVRAETPRPSGVGGVFLLQLKASHTALCS